MKSMKPISSYLFACIKATSFGIPVVLLSIFGQVETGVAQQWADGWNSHTRHINDIKITPDHDVFLFGGYPPDLANDRIIFRVVDYGQNWYNWEVVSGYADGWITDVEYLNEDTAIAVGANGSIIRTFDGGFVWDSLYTDTTRYISSIDMIGYDYGLIAGGDSVEQVQTVKRTLNGGESWTSVRDVTGSYLRSVFCIDGNKSFAVGDNGTVVKTLDGGDVWTTVNVPVNRHFHEVYFFDSNIGIIVGGDVLVRTILRTVNGGDTWSTIIDEAGGMLYDMHFIDGSIGYAVGDHGQFLKTNDGGLNWTFEIVPNMSVDDHLYSVNFESENFGFLSGVFGRYFMYTDFDVPNVQTGLVLTQSQETVTFQANVNTGGGAASAFFIYSISPDLSNSDTTNAIVLNSTSPESINITDWGFEPNTTYYYTCKAEHLTGSATGDTLSFSSSFGVGVELYTEEATLVTATDAQLNASVSGLTEPGSVFFDYNILGGNTISVVADPSSVSDDLLYSLTAPLSGLSPNANYQFRIRIESGFTTLLGNYVQFYTGTASVLTNLEPSGVSFTTATFHGEAENLHLSADVYFDYWPTEGGGLQGGIVPATPSQITDENFYSVTTALADLTPNTYYQCRLTVQNELGFLSSGVQEFYTGVENALVTNPATGVAAGQATLRGHLNGLNSYPGTAWFEYFKLGNDTVTIASDLAIVNGPNEEHSAVVTGIQSDTVYGFRIKVYDNDGVVYYGATRQIHTGSNPIPNYDFEEWTLTNGEHPTDWFNLFGPVEKISPGQTGNHAVKLEFLDPNHMGALFNGAMAEIDGAFQFVGGFGIPFITQPDSFAGMFEYDFAPEDSATIIIGLSSQGEIISQTIHKLGGSSSTAYVEKKFPISYSSSAIPDTFMIGMIAANIFASGFTPQAGDYLKVDEVRFTGDQPQIPNNGFEQWDSFSFDQLDDWEYLDMYNYGIYLDPDDGMVVQNTSSQHGSYAAEVRNIDIGEETGMMVPGLIAGNINTLTADETGSPSFPLEHQPQALHGYYKFFPENGDSLVISCALFNEGIPTGSNQRELVITEQAEDYTSFTLDLELGYTPADSATISIEPYNTLPLGLSKAMVDNLRFDGFSDELVVGRVELSASSPQLSFNLYPNPTNGILNWRASNVHTEEFTISIIDPLGRTVVMEKIDLSNKANSALGQMNLGELSSGLYMVEVQSDPTRKTKYLVKY